MSINATAKKPVFPAVVGLVLLVGLAGPAVAELVGAEPKALRLEEERPAERLQVVLEPAKTSFGVNEPVRLSVRGNREFYLYLITENEETGEKTLLMPNAKQTSNKYPGGASFTVPDREVSIVSDKPGRETITMIATDRYVDIDTSRFSKAGDFFRAKGAAINEEFLRKGLQITDNRQPSGSQNDAVIQDIEIEVRKSGGLLGLILGDEPPPDRPDASTITLLSLDGDQYRVGDRLQVAYGANRKGTVTLYAIKPDGSYSTLLSDAVDGQALETATFVAESAGLHTLIAVHAEKQEPSHGDIERLLSSAKDKGLRVLGDVQPGQPSHAIAEFRVVE